MGISDRNRQNLDRSQAEAADLQNCESLYRLLFKSSPNPMWIYDPETLAFLEVNPAAITQYGYSQAEFLQMTIADFCPPTEVVTPHQSNLNLTPETLHVSCKHRKKDGTLIDVEVVAHAFSVSGKQATLALIKDITELQWHEADRQKAERDLHEAHQRIITTWESMTDAYAAFDLDWNFTYVNRAAANVITQLTGTAPEDILGQSHWKIFSVLAGGMLEHRYRQSLAEQIPAHFDYLYEPTGNWFEIHAYPSPLGLGVYFRDISDRKQAEQKILEQAALLDIASDAIYVCDLNHHILYWNQGAERLYGWSAAQAIGQKANELFQENVDQISEIRQVLLQNGKWQGEIHKVTQSGQEVIIDGRWTLVRDELSPKSILAVDTDVTEKKQLEVQFLRAQRLESLGTLASGIAHDLNNVLTPIIGIVQLLPLKLPNSDEQTQRMLQILKESAQRGADLVKQILSFTRGVEGKTSNTQISHLLLEIQKVIQQTFPKNIELTSDLPQNLWLIAADATLLHQVFMNLCVNARDAMPNGGKLSLSAENLLIDANYARIHLDAQVGSYVVVTITDTGLGIPSNIMDSIFDPFFTTKEAGKGTGLGLSTVIGIVKSHHGFVNVYSKVSKGTQFKVYFPATELSEIEPIPEAEPQPGNGELILVVDDEVAVQEIIQATLETHGYQVMIANDGIEAIALYAEHKNRINAVLLDLMMPSLDSVTIIRTLFKINATVQIIAMSGLSTQESVAKTMNEGIQSFLAKPFAASELLTTLSHLCSSNR